MAQIDWLVIGYSLGSAVALMIYGLCIRWRARWEINFPLMLNAMLLIAIGFSAFIFGMNVTGTVPSRAGDPAFVLGVFLWMGGLFFLMTGAAGTFISSLDKKFPVPRHWFWSTNIAALLLAAALAVFPWLRIPAGSLVAQDGKVLPFGSDYQLRPGLKTKIVGLDNPAPVSFSLPRGKHETVIFSARVDLHLAPGDEIPRDFKWYPFRKELDKWFAERLDGDYNLSSDRRRNSIGRTERTLVMGLPVSWDGKYEFRLR